MGHGVLVTKLADEGHLIGNVRWLFREYAVWWPWLLAFALTAVFVNPLRETAVMDEPAFALSVRGVLESGKYEWHPWASANIPFQAYWGAIFARLGGYSFSALRISTLMLALIGLISFYYLAKEHRLDSSQANLLVIGLFASPLVVGLSFSFMTDVPFLACLVGALLFYTRAIRLQSYPLLLVGSTFACAAVLTRQFGLALVAGLLTEWALRSDRWRQAAFFLSGAALPGAAGVWQLATSIMAPSWAAQVDLRAQRLFLANPGSALMEIGWRLGVALHYLALFCWPFVFLVLVVLALRVREARRGDSLESVVVNRDVVVVGIVALYVIGGMVYGRYGKGVSWLMPYIPWNFWSLEASGGFERTLVTLATGLGGVVVARVVALRYVGRQGWASVPPGERLLDLVTGYLLVLHLLFVQFGDRYLLGVLPFTLIVMGQHLGSWLNRLKIIAVVACLGMLIASGVWTRRLLAGQEAVWKGAEFVRMSGVEASEIWASLPWVFYYRFGDYITEIGHRELVDYADLFQRWLPEQQRRARFVVARTREAPVGEKWEVLRAISYRGGLFRDQHVYVVRRERGL